MCVRVRDKIFFTERRSTFSLRSTKIESWVFVGARSKVGPRIKSYAWVPKSWSFIKLHKVGNFPTWIIFSLKARAETSRVF